MGVAFPVRQTSSDGGTPRSPAVAIRLPSLLGYSLLEPYNSMPAWSVDEDGSEDWLPSGPPGKPRGVLIDPSGEVSVPPPRVSRIGCPTARKANSLGVLVGPLPQGRSL